MKHLNEIFPAVINAIKFRFSQWALVRETAKKNSIVQYWQAGALGGGSNLDLGNMTRPEALQLVRDLKAGPIVFIDDDSGFIAFGHPPQAPGSDVQNP